MNATVTIDRNVHTYTCTWMPRSFREGGDRYLATCSCGWRGTPVAGVGEDTAQWNAHVAHCRQTDGPRAA